MKVQAIRLGVNVDHVATVRQARGTPYPDPVEAALLAASSGADGITIHLREDRRHIQEHDVQRLLAESSVPVNLEMAVTEQMLDIALRSAPPHCCLVPERREELTTEGGLDVAGQQQRINEACARLADASVRVSLFVDPEARQLEAALATGAAAVEIHTGAYADAAAGAAQAAELQRIRDLFPGQFDILAARLESEPVAGVVLLVSRHAARLQYIVSSAEGYARNALDPVIDRCIADERGRGRRYLDFGTSTLDAGRALSDGVQGFKAGFGAGSILQQVWELEL